VDIFRECAPNRRNKAMTSKIQKTRMTAAQQEAFMARAAQRLHLSEADLNAFKEKYGETSLYLMQSALLFKNINQNLDTKVGSSSAAIHQMLKQDLSATQIANITGLSEQDIASMLPVPSAQATAETKSVPEATATQPEVSDKEQIWQALLTARKEQSANYEPLLQSLVGKKYISTEEEMKSAKNSLDAFMATWHEDTLPTLADYVSYLSKTVEQAQLANQQAQKSEEQHDVATPHQEKKNIFQRFWGKVTGKNKEEKATKVVAETSPKTTVAENTAKTPEATSTRSVSTPATKTPEISVKDLSRLSGNSATAKTTTDTKSALQVDAIKLARFTSTPSIKTYTAKENNVSNNEVESQKKLDSALDAKVTATPSAEEIAQTEAARAKQAFIDKAYAQISQNGNEQTIKELLDSCYITKADVQTTLQNNPELFQDVKEGTFNKKLAKQADKVKGKCGGSCLGGVQTIFAGAGYPEYLAGSNFPRMKRQKGNSSNAACDLPYAIENYCAKNGQKDAFVCITVDNDSDINQTLSYLPAGQVFAFSNKEGYSANKGNIFGHTAITTNRGTFASDGVQTSINRERYGSTVSIMLKTDNLSNEELTKAFLAQAYDRQENERMLAAAKTQQNSTTLAAVTTQNERG
jgi:hypothetical protein